MRGEKEVQALFKPPRTRKRKGDEQAAADAVDEDAEQSELELQDEDGDGWHQLSDSGSEVDVVEEAPIAPTPAKKGKKAAPAFRKPREFVGKVTGTKGKGKGKARAAGPEVVIDDSDVDDEVIL
jgi:hypothetical protein